MIYCFDTSALNRLLDDPDRDVITTALLATASFRITGYNVLEAANTKDPARRIALVKLMRRLTNNKRPVDLPNSVVRTAARAYAEKTPDVTVNADPNLEGLWVALNEPELLDDSARQESLDWAKNWSDEFDSIAAGKREQFQELFQKKGATRPRTPAGTLRGYSELKELIRDRLIGRIYERETGKSLNPADFEELMEEPIWSLYLGAYAYAFHQRSIRQHGYSRSRHAGAIDLGQAVYLAMCDRFVTDDKTQYRALRLLNTLNTKRDTQVLRYDTFRRRLLLL